jgi:hypothetical protein
MGTLALRSALVLGLAGLSCIVFGHANPKLEFEVATVKPAAPRLAGQSHAAVRDLAILSTFGIPSFP